MSTMPTPSAAFPVSAVRGVANAALVPQRLLVRLGGGWLGCSSRRASLALLTEPAHPPPQPQLRQPRHQEDEGAKAQKQVSDGEHFAERGPRREVAIADGGQG